MQQTDSLPDVITYNAAISAREHSEHGKGGFAKRHPLHLGGLTSMTIPDLGTLASAGEDCMQVQEAFLEHVGWRVSKKPSKRRPMCPSFIVLGVVFQLEQSVSGTLSAAEASFLMGRFQYSEGQLFARIGGLSS